MNINPKVTAATVAELVSFLRSEYGSLPLSPHRQWNATACPGIWDLPRIDRLAGSAAIAPQSSTTTDKLEAIMASFTPEERQSVLDAAAKINRYLNAPIGDLPEKTVKALLEEPIQRKGGTRSGDTTLGNTIAYLDSNLDEVKVKP